ncbi:MAG TPA: S8 family serine peptidase, partial [Pyrinomonadaceae bacterium]|nr:S8 family serine peptidase [Pyrinomonadaceae bacterium]
MRFSKHYRLRSLLASLAVAASLSAATPRQASAGARAFSEPRAKISRDLLAGLRRDGDRGGRVNVIVQLEDGAAISPLDALVGALGGRVTRRLERLGARAVSLPRRAVEALAARPEVRFVSPDRAVAAAGHLETTTGAAAVRTQVTFSLLGITTTTTLDGVGVGIAVVDSGIDSGHQAFRGALGESRVAVARDFTGEGRTDDPFGHGTHVASIAAGGDVWGGAYTGLAPAAKIINLRVLGSEGTGTTSGLLAALDWALLNRAAYQIGVVNLSLGTAAVDSYEDEPVCRAVRRLVDSGVVVVAAAGNNGKDGAANKIYGQIHSPGIEPSAIT